MQHLYRHFDKTGALLYVGISLSTVKRLSEHKQGSHWYRDIVRVEIEHYETREEAIAAEIAAIRAENPLHNIQRHLEVLKPTAMVAKSDQSIVVFKAMYSLSDAAGTLDISHNMLLRLIDDKKIGFVIVGHRHNAQGSKPILKITGWQLIAFLEALTTGEVVI